MKDNSRITASCSYFPSTRVSGDWNSDPHRLSKNFCSPAGYERRSLDKGENRRHSDTSDEQFPTFQRPAAFLEAEPKASEAAICLAGPTEPSARTATSGFVIQPSSEAAICLGSSTEPESRTATSGVVIHPAATQDATLCSEVAPRRPVSSEERLYRAPTGPGRLGSEDSCLASELEELPGAREKTPQGLSSPISCGSEVGTLRDVPSLRRERGRLDDLATERRRAASLDTAQLRAKKLKEEEEDDDDNDSLIVCDGRWRGLIDPRLRSPDSEHSWTLRERQQPSNSSLRGVRESIERLPFFLHSARLLFRTLPHRRRHRAKNATLMAALAGADSGLKRRSRRLPWRSSRHKSHTLAPPRPGHDLLDCVRDEKTRDRAIVADGGVRGVFRRTGSILEARPGRRKRRATVEVKRNAAFLGRVILYT